MFGYVKPCKPQLRICEYEVYKAVYCGLCKQLGREYGPFSRLTLNYDFTFLALLQMGMQEGGGAFSPGRCLLNPLKRMPCCDPGPSLSFSGSTAMIMFYYKALDNYNDGGIGQKMLALLVRPFVRRAYQKAAQQYPEFSIFIYYTITKHRDVESLLCECVDAARAPTALALSGICALLAQDAQQKRVLERFGYLLGRYIYLADALDDLEEDIAHHSYNPFLLREKLADAPFVPPEQLAHIREEAKGSLFLTIGEIGKAYSLLPIAQYQPILENIVYLGLRTTVEQILQPKEAKHPK